MEIRQEFKVLMSRKGVSILTIFKIMFMFASFNEFLAARPHLENIYFHCFSELKCIFIIIKKRKMGLITITRTILGRTEKSNLQTTFSMFS